MERRASLSVRSAISAIKKACVLVAVSLVLPLFPATAQSEDPMDLLWSIFAASAELSECDSQYLVIEYNACQDQYNYHDLQNGYTHTDQNYSITIKTTNSQECHYNKYMADYTDGELLWQSYILACAIKWKEEPAQGWQINDYTLDSWEAYLSSVDYDFAYSLIYGFNPKIKIVKRKHYFLIKHKLAPFLAEYRLEKKVKGKWITKYDRINVEDLQGNTEKIKGRGRYRLTVIKFDGTIAYRKTFLVR